MDDEHGASEDWGGHARRLGGAEGPDRLILVAGALLLIDSFLPWYGFSIGPFSVTVRGWSSGGLAVLSILFGIGALVWTVLSVAGVPTGVDARASGIVYLVLGVGSFAFALLRLLTESSLTKYGLYLAIVLTGVLAYASYLKYRAANR